MKDITNILFQHKKIGRAEEGPPFFKDINKSKSKDFTLGDRLSIILSRYRGMTITKQNLANVPEQKDSK